MAMNIEQSFLCETINIFNFNFPHKVIALLEEHAPGCSFLLQKSHGRINFKAEISSEKRVMNHTQNSKHRIF